MAIKVLSFSYAEFPIRDPVTGEIIGQTFRPMIPIRISYEYHLSRLFEALVDSGSDRNLLPADIGEAIGINFRKYKPIFIYGIGGIKVKAFPVKIKLFIGNLPYFTEVDFSYEQRIPILGRRGFFNLFQKVVFDENFHQLQLILKTES